MRKTMVSLRGFQPPRMRDQSSAAIDHTSPNVPEPRKRLRAESPAQLSLAPSPLNFSDVEPPHISRASFDTTEAAEAPPPVLGGVHSVSAAIEPSPAQDESDATLLREVEEDMRLSADLAFTPIRAGHSPPSQPSLAPPFDGEEDRGAALLPGNTGDMFNISDNEKSQSDCVKQVSVSLERDDVSIGFYDLPESVQSFFAARRGIHQLYQWQHDVLMRSDVRKGSSLVYSMPTSGGKTLVAEISLLRCLLNRKKSCFFVLPYVSLADEKTQSLKLLGDSFDFTVEGHYGTNGRFPLPQGRTAFVCTIEKANSVLNHLLEEGATDRLGAVVVDELHMLGESRRGATLELFLSKLLCLSHDVQIIGMSATIPNLPAIATWLHATCYIGQYRPVPLKQHSVVGGMVIEENTSNTRNLVTAGCSSEIEQLVLLATEVAGASVLVFCASRMQCVETAQLIAQRRGPCGAGDAHITSLVDDLRSLSNGDHSPLVNLVAHRVAFHHGGLLAEERGLIERAYRLRHVDILCCTSTLAAGVNLPARRVLFKTPYVGRDFLTKAQYLQMCGRAGRAGLDEFGESFLLLARRDESRGRKLMRSEVEPCGSQMLVDAKSFERAILESITVGIIRNTRDAHRWAGNLLCHLAPGPCDPTFDAASRPLALILGDAVQSSLNRLIECDLVVRRASSDDQDVDAGEDNMLLLSTPFGSSSVRSCFSVDEALSVRRELEDLQRNGLILVDDLHLCYFLTPVRDTVDCDWLLYRDILAKLSEPRQRIAALVGVDEFFVDQRAMGLGGPAGADAGGTKFFTTRRFFAALILTELLSEVPMDVVEKKYQCNRGQLQNLMRSASMFSSSITNFCRAMEWFSLEAVLASFVKRLGFGVKPDIIPLMEIKGLQPPRARALWLAGFRDPASIAAVTPHELLTRVKNTNPADSKTVKYFSLRSALSIVREADNYVRNHIREKKGELIELSLRTRASR